MIVTTAVQFFESLFTAHPGHSRKIHRVAGAVVFLDEAQMLPPDFLLVLLRYLEELMRRYGTSVVLSTATQPALDPRPTTRPPFPGLKGPGSRREIVADPDALYEAMRRVRVFLPSSLDASITWEALAADLAAEPSALCIVDKRKDARDLHALMPEGARHLSGLMCGAHLCDWVLASRSLPSIIWQPGVQRQGVGCGIKSGNDGAEGLSVHGQSRRPDCAQC